MIAAQAEPGVDRKLRSLFTILTAVNRDAYLPLVELALPALKSCSPQQIARFQQVMHRLIRDDNHVSLFEWCLKTVINNNLVSTATGVVSQRVTRQQLGRVQIQVRVILSLLTQAGSDDENERQQAFALALEELQQPSAPMYSAADLRFETVDNALKQLDSLLPLEKKRFITACLKLIAADQIIEVEEIEIVRAIAAALHCPMPPVPRLAAA
jgi:hypothetical protein